MDEGLPPLPEAAEDAAWFKWREQFKDYVTGATPFTALELGGFAEHYCQERIGVILGCELLGIGFDSYDGSFEIYPGEDVADVLPTEEQHARILALGCSRYWINFPDNTQRYMRGSRVQTNECRWDRHNTFRDARRSEVQQAAEAAVLQERAKWEKDAVRFQWYFSDKPKGDWLMTYLDGIRTGWKIDEWRAAIDAAIRAAQPTKER